MITEAPYPTTEVDIKRFYTVEGRDTKKQESEMERLILERPAYLVSLVLEEMRSLHNPLLINDAQGTITPGLERKTEGVYDRTSGKIFWEVDYGYPPATEDVILYPAFDEHLLNPTNIVGTYPARLYSIVDPKNPEDRTSFVLVNGPLKTEQIQSQEGIPLIS